MSETENPSDGNAAADDAALDDENVEVVLTKKQVDDLFVRAKNAAAAEMRRAGEFKRPKPEDDPRIARGLELLQRYEQAETTYERDRRFNEKRYAANPNWHPRETPKPEILRLGEPQRQTAAQPTSELGQLVELMKMDIASRMADKLPKAPVTYASPGDEIRASINESIAAIPEDDPQRGLKVQRAVLDKLKGVRVTPLPHNPNSALMPKRK